MSVAARFFAITTVSMRYVCVCGTFDPRVGWFEKGGLALCEHALKKSMMEKSNGLESR